MKGSCWASSLQINARVASKRHGARDCLAIFPSYALWTPDSQASWPSDGAGGQGPIRSCASAAGEKRTSAVRAGHVHPSGRRRQQRGSWWSGGLWQAPGARTAFLCLSRNEAGETRGLGFVDSGSGNLIAPPWGSGAFFFPPIWGEHRPCPPAGRCSSACTVPAHSPIEAELRPSQPRCGAFQLQHDHTKYELITETGHLKAPDRVGYSSLAYPFAYRLHSPHLGRRRMGPASTFEIVSVTEAFGARPQPVRLGSICPS